MHRRKNGLEVIAQKLQLFQSHFPKKNNLPTKPVIRQVPHEKRMNQRQDPRFVKSLHILTYHPDRDTAAAAMYLVDYDQGMNGTLALIRLGIDFRYLVEKMTLQELESLDLSYGLNQDPGQKRLVLAALVTLMQDQSIIVDEYGELTINQQTDFLLEM